MRQNAFQGHLFSMSTGSSARACAQCAVRTACQTPAFEPRLPVGCLWPQSMHNAWQPNALHREGRRTARYYQQHLHLVGMQDSDARHRTCTGLD